MKFKFVKLVIVMIIFFLGLTYLNYKIEEESTLINLL